MNVFCRTFNRLGNKYVILKFLKRSFPLYTKTWASKLNYSIVALCVAKKIELQSPKNLTHEYLIQQASSVAVNAATQLLTQTVVAIIDTGEEYSKALSDLMSLLEDSRNVFGNDHVQQELSDLLIAARSKVNDFKTQLIQLDSLLTYVEKMVVSTAETSFLAGAEFLSTSLSERLINAKSQVDDVKRKIKILEDECLVLQKNVIIDTKD
ncbi:hypothetical protein O3M35_001029 [Rhynocoris fuscipes]|uniref:Direct IAP-binding protein with low pI n=1 Tax=Rhynocoris fuscipes TaxID=488301 RepID=A0AAW1DT48_9HEMI